MVQDSGADSLRVDIVIQTIAKIRAIEEASATLRKLSEETGRARNVLGQYTAQTIESAEATRRSQGALSEILEKGFSPRFIGSIQGVNAALVSGGKTFQQYTTEAKKSGQISDATASEFGILSQSMIGVGATGKATIATIDELSNQLAGISVGSDAGKAAVQALGNELNVLKTQFVEAGNAAEQRLNRPLQNTQKAGQGLLLSFSLTQLAAGRLSQAMFGLGFAVLFTGTSFLNLITISVALGAALLSIGLQKLELLFQESASASERATERIKTYTDALDELKGELGLVTDELVRLIELEGLETVFEAKKIDEQTEAFSAFRNAVEEFNSTIGEGPERFKALSDAAVEFGIDIRTTGEESRIYTDIVKGGIVTQDEFRRLVKISSFDMEDYGRTLEETSAAALTLADSLRDEALEALREFDEQVERRRELEVAIAPFEIDVENVRDEISRQIEDVRDGLVIQLDVIRDALQEQVDLRREALEEETQIIQDELERQTDIIQDNLADQIAAIEDQRDKRIEIIQEGLDEELEAIRKQTNDRIDEIRDSSDAETKIIKDRADDQIAIIKENAAAEIEVNKDRIKELQDQDRELQRVLATLQDRRLDIIFAKIASQATLAELERQARIVGVETSEEQAILEARIAGLDAQQAATEDEIEAREESISSIQDQIDTIEDLINEIEKSRDAAIDVAKETRDALIKASRDARDAAIDDARETSRTRQKEARKAADAEIKEAQRSAEGSKNAARDKADAEIRIAGRATAILIKEAKKRADADITQAKRSSTGREREVRNTTNAIINDLNREKAVRLATIEVAKKQRTADLRRANMIKDVVLPALLDEFLLQSQIFKVQIARLPAGVEQAEARGDLIGLIFDLAFLVNQLNIPTDIAFWNQISNLLGFQSGGIVPGAPGQPQLVLAHGGEEINPPGGSLAALKPGIEGPLFTIHIDKVEVNKRSDLKKISSAAVRGMNKALGQEMVITSRSKRFNTR